MKVKKIYQDEREHWHIDYQPNHLIGLALRVYIGQILITLIIMGILFAISIIINLMMGEPILDLKRDSQPETSPQEQLFSPN
ncbi:MAG: hypothetical protein QNJ72_12995 [Pleurocapsa sp. MO_226.B13]|nr:hypothetical protein [Pleurocapsa sp. MO_226.B13]